MRPLLTTAIIAAVLYVAVTMAGALSAHAATPPMDHMKMAAAAPKAPVAATSVSIKDFAFVPATIVVAPGATVTWTNADDEPHTATANEGEFKSPALDTDQRYVHVFAKPGEYRYFCSLHPHMTGVVIVRAPSAAKGS